MQCVFCDTKKSEFSVHSELIIGLSALKVLFVFFFAKMTWFSSTSRYSELSIWIDIKLSNLLPLIIKQLIIQLIHHIQGGSTGWTHLNSKRRLNTRQTAGSGITKFSTRSTDWLAWATLKTLLNSSHVLFWYTQKLLCCIVAILHSTDAAAWL